MTNSMPDPEVNINHRKNVLDFLEAGAWGEQSKTERESNCLLDKRFINAKSVVEV